MNEFDSYIDWYNNLLKMPLNDVILGVKDTIEDKTVYLSLSDSKVLKMDNTSFVMATIIKLFYLLKMLMMNLSDLSEMFCKTVGI